MMRPALLLLSFLLLPPAMQAQTLDNTLFTSPEQREYLDYLREDFLLQNQQTGFDIEESLIPDIPINGPIGPSGPAEYSLSGIMRRSDGSLTIWLNDQQLAEQELPASASLVREGNSYALRFATSTGARLLRPGQTLTIESGSVQERFQRPPPATAEAAVDAVNAAAAETQGAADEDNADEATSVATADTAEVTADSASGEASEAETADPASLIDKLPDSVRNSAEKIQSMIDNLQALQESISEVTDPE